MPRIRKKTSKRGTTNQREKIKHKVSETRKKRKKEAKKNPQWKSKHKKDPGIPNNFPYKDQILAEVAEKRRQAEEAKQLRKEQKKALKAGVVAEDVEEEDEASDGEGSDVGGYVGVSAVRAAGSSRQEKGSKESAEGDVEGGQEQAEVVDSELGSLKEVLEEADVVIEVLDARDPLAYHSEHLAELVKAKKGQKLLLVLNKIDATPREVVSSWSTHLRSQHPTLLFRAASAFLPSLDPTPAPSKGKGKARADDALGLDALLSLLSQWAQPHSSKDDDKPFTVAVVGFTNSGKSSLVNSLLRNSALPVYQLASSTANEGPTTTARAQEVTLEVEGKQIRVIDTPGYSWQPETEQSADSVEATRVRDILVRNKGRIERLKDPEPVVHHIVSRATQEDLMLFYNLPAFAQNDTEAFSRALARAKGLVKKGGVVDIAGASRIVLRDWSTGRLPRYTTPPASSSPAAVSSEADETLATFYAGDEKILAQLPTKKEARAGTGLVKLKALEAEARQLVLDTKWVGDEDSEDEEDEDVDADQDADQDAEGSEEESEEEDEEDGDEDDEEEEEEEDEPAPTIAKRKRGLAKATDARPTKKVAFSAEPKNTKQARKAGSLLAKVKASTAPAKSALKTATKVPKAKAQPAGKVAPAAKKAANAPSKKSAAPAGNDEYDFGKFF